MAAVVTLGMALGGCGITRHLGGLRLCVVRLVRTVLSGVKEIQSVFCRRCDLVSKRKLTDRLTHI